MFTISVLVKLSLDWRKLLESFILGGFVLDKVWNEVTVTAGGGMSTAAGGGVNHVAHIAGALCGVLLIVLLSKALPKDGADRAAQRRTTTSLQS